MAVPARKMAELFLSQNKHPTASGTSRLQDENKSVREFSSTIPIHNNTAQAAAVFIAVLPIDY